LADPGLARDCLFQLNVLIWACWPQPPEAPVTPALRRAGYQLFWIEQPLEAGLSVLARQRASGLPIGPNPVADAVLRRGDAFTLLECKPSSFSPASEASAQARGLIVAGANLPARLPGLPGTASGEVCYLVPWEDTAAMDATLMELASEVVGEGLAACPTGPLGLFVKEDGVYLGLSASPAGSARLSRVLIPEERVAAAEPGQDPRPLYVVPWIPDAPDGSDLTALREKLRAHTLAWLGRAPLGGEATFAFADLLDEVSRGVFALWRDRRSLHGRVFPVISGSLAALLGSDPRVTLRSDALRVRLAAESDREELMDRVRGMEPGRSREGMQIPMSEEA